MENTFKYGLHAHLASLIQFTLHSSPNNLYFESRNYIFRESRDSDEESGIGLANVRQQLALYYPDQHGLTTVEVTGEFIVTLKIQV
ncbi:LytS family sensor histidine kinase [Spirosoma flavum]|uniref:GHKL domain-containing protein n=1 Tax=Spirosoma flavum TaxID=2048557 RepID=A0ABW6AK90_9BACT